MIKLCTNNRWGLMSMAVQQLVIFRIDKEDFGVEITQVREIIRPQEIFKIPNAPEFIEGLINLRGKVHTVYNLKKRFSMSDHTFDDNTKIIIVSVQGLMVGFIVDEVNEIVRVDTEDIESTPPSIVSIDKKYITGIAKLDKKLVLLLDLTKVLSIEDTDSLKKLVQNNSN